MARITMRKTQETKLSEIFTLYLASAAARGVKDKTLHKALCKYSVLKFNTLKSYFPNLKSTREFITSKNYMGGIKVEITSKHEKPIPHMLFIACANVLEKVAASVSAIKVTYEGTTEFKPTRIYEMFKDKKCNFCV